MYNIGLVTNFLCIVPFILLFLLWFIFNVIFFMAGFSFCEFYYELTINKLRTVRLKENISSTNHQHTVRIMRLKENIGINQGRGNVKSSYLLYCKGCLDWSKRIWKSLFIRSREDWFFVLERFWH